MKKILLILVVSAFASCKTERIYLIILPQEEVKMVKIKKYRDTVFRNRFTNEFNGADSVFRVIEKASDKAMKSAKEKTQY